MRFRIVPLVLIAAACSGRRVVPGAALESINAQDLARHVQVLASDSFGGRAPSTPGETLTINYLRDQFKAMGLQPGNDTSYFQAVPLVRITADPSAELLINRRGTINRYHYGEQFMAWTKRIEPEVDLTNSNLVFVGYGIVAPEYHWNDYAGVDVRGKTVIILVNDPGFATQDTSLFQGKTMTYYGRWTYKYEEAARQGAAGAIIVHETAPAAYPWDVVRNSWSGPQFELEAADSNRSRAAIEGWVTHATAREIFQLAGLDYEQLKTKAATRGFHAVPLAGVTMTLHLKNSIAHSVSHNVLATLPGTDHRDEYVIYTAHWDHFGTDSSRPGDKIFNGARDNGTGVAALLALAKAFATLGTPPSRSVLFLSVTGEERGLLGSEYYATHPVHPLAKTVADINMDAMNIWGRTHDVTVIGFGKSALDDYAEAAAKAQGRVVHADAEPEKGFYYRSDHFSFAKQGVPALDLGVGVDNVEHGEAWMREQLDEYTQQRYHKPSDEYDAKTWDLSGLVQDTRLLLRIGYQLANTRAFPDWREGTEFRAARDSMMAAR